MSDLYLRSELDKGDLLSLLSQEDKLLMDTFNEIFNGVSKITLEYIADSTVTILREGSSVIT